MQKKYQFTSYDVKYVELIQQQHDCSYLMAQLLSQRVKNLEHTEDFLSPRLKKLLPNPFELWEMSRAIERMVRAIKNQEQITLFGDYDVDGSTSTALLYRYLKSIGCEQVTFYIPDRHIEGYGPNREAFETLSHNADVLITLDCGSTAEESIQIAKNQGTDVLVLDHHMSTVRPQSAYAFVNPNLEGHPHSPSQQMAAVAITFLFCVGLQKTLRDQKFFLESQEPNLMLFLDLVALGTACDIMPLTPINRAFIQNGLKILESPQANLGLQTLLTIAKKTQQTPLDIYDLSFILGPRINAGSRISDSMLGAHLLTTDSPTEAFIYGDKLNALNTERQHLEKKVLREALERAQKQHTLSPCIVLADKEWHQGIIGIIASRIKDRYHQPTFIISTSNGILKGSGRSVPGVHLGKIVNEAVQQGILLAGGGHAQAAGISLTEENLPHFETFLQKKLHGFNYTPILTISAVVAPHLLTLDYAESLEYLKPFGPQNTEPVFMIPYLQVETLLPLGTEHYKILFRSEEGTRIKTIGFRIQNTPLDDFLSSSPKPFHALGKIKLNRWNQKKEVQFILEDIIQDTTFLLPSDLKRDAKSIL